jgi:putative ABC transport system permease protein
VIFKKALGDLWARKLRTVLVVLSIAVGVFGLSSIRILGEQIERGAVAKFATSNPADLTVDTTATSAAKRDRVVEVDNVQSLQSRVGGTARWKPPGGDRKENLAIQGVDDPSGSGTFDRVRVVRGSAPGEGEILFEKEARAKYNLAIGQEVTLVGPDGDLKFRVSGFGDNPNVAGAGAVGFASAWLSKADVEKVLKIGGDNRLLIRMKNNATAGVREETEKRVQETLESNEVTVLGTQVRDPTTLPGKDQIDSLRTILLVFALVGACASGLLVINTISTIVLEQRPQIGSMKAVGASTQQVMLTYLLLSLLYGVLGTILGLGAGIGLNVLAGNARAVQQDEEVIPLILSGEAIGMAIAVGIGVGVLASVVPSWMGARVTIREAMVSYGLSADFGRGLWDRLMGRLTGLPQAATLASRNVFRQTNRAVFTILGLAITTAVILAIFAALSSLFGSLDASIQALRADVNIAFDAPAERAAVDKALENVSGIERRELWLVSSAKTGGKSVAVSGLPVDTQIFETASVSQGRWIKEGETTEAVITRRLAERQKVALGSTLELQSGTRPVQRWTVVGITGGAGPDALAPDGALYAPYEAVRGLVDFPADRGNQLYVRLADRDQANVDAKTTSIADALADASLANTPVKLYEQQQSNQANFLPLVLVFVLMILIVAVVGALGLFSTLTMNVFERQKEIGVMRSVGAPTGTILWIFLLEGLLLGLLGWALGVAASGPAASTLVGFLSDKLVSMEYVFPPSGLVITLVAILGVAFVSSIGPSLAAARMRIAQILRYG